MSAPEKMSAFVLKLKTKSGSVIIKGLNGKNKVSDLLKILADITNCNPENTNVLRGFPPKPMNLSCSEASLEDIGLHSGETLIVEQSHTLATSSTAGAASSVHTNANKPANVSRLAPYGNVVSLSVPGVVLKQVIPGDNSCLFTSVGFCLFGNVDVSCAFQMRDVIACNVAAEPTIYSEAMLGKPNVDYCEWIRKPDSWGGGIELSVLSKFFHCEMSVVNVVSAVISTFGEDQQYRRRAYLVFDGVHYDALYLEPFEAGVPIQTLFLPDDGIILREVHSFIEKAHLRKEYTDLHSFSLQCGQCGTGLRGHEQATVHARITGHTEFREVSSS